MPNDNSEILQLRIGADNSDFLKAFQASTQAVISLRDTFKEGFGKMQESTKQTEEKQKSLKDSILAVGVAGVVAFKGVETVIKGVIGAFAEFDTMQRRMKAQLGATAEEAAKLNQSIMQLGKNIDTKKIVDAYTAMGREGYNATESMKMLNGVIGLSRATQNDYATSVQQLTGIMKSYNIPVFEASKLTDKLAVGAKQAKTSIDYYATALATAGTYAEIYGQSLDEMAIAIDAAGQKGLRANVAVSKFGLIMAQLSMPMGQTADVMKTLGIHINDINGNMIPLTKITDQFRVATLGMTEAEKNRNAIQLVGRRNLKEFMALVSTTPEQFKQFENGLNNSTGRINEFKDAMKGDLNTEMGKLNASMNLFKIQIGESLAPIIAKIVEGLRGLVDAFLSLDSNTKNIIASIGGAIAAFAAIGGVAMAFTATITSLTPVWVALTGAVAAFGVTLGIATAPIWITIGAVGLLSAGVILLTKNIFDSNRAHDEAAEKARKLEKAQYDQLKSNTELHQNLRSLVAERDKLIKKETLSSEEKKKLLDFTERIKKINPELAKSLATNTGEFDREAKAVDKVTNAYKRQIIETIALINIKRQNAQADINAAEAQITANYQLNKGATKDWQNSNYITNQADQVKLLREAGIKKREFDAQIIELKKERKLLESAAAPLKTEKTQYGADNYGDEEKNAKAAEEAKKKAEEAYKKRVESSKKTFEEEQKRLNAEWENSDKSIEKFSELNTELFDLAKAYQAVNKEATINTLAVKTNVDQIALEHNGIQKWKNACALTTKEMILMSNASEKLKKELKSGGNYDWVPNWKNLVSKGLAQYVPANQMKAGDIGVTQGEGHIGVMTNKGFSNVSTSSGYKFVNSRKSDFNYAYGLRLGGGKGGNTSGDNSMQSALDFSEKMYADLLKTAQKSAENLETIEKQKIQNTLSLMTEGYEKEQFINENNYKAQLKTIQDTYDKEVEAAQGNKNLIAQADEIKFNAKMQAFNDFTDKEKELQTKSYAEALARDAEFRKAEETANQAASDAKDKALKDEIDKSNAAAKKVTEGLIQAEKDKQQAISQSIDIVGNLFDGLGVKIDTGFIKNLQGAFSFGIDNILKDFGAAFLNPQSGLVGIAMAAAQMVGQVLKGLWDELSGENARRLLEVKSNIENKAAQRENAKKIEALNTNTAPMTLDDYTKKRNEYLQKDLFLVDENNKKTQEKINNLQALSALGRLGIEGKIELENLKAQMDDVKNIKEELTNTAQTDISKFQQKLIDTNQETLDKINAGKDAARTRDYENSVESAQKISEEITKNNQKSEDEWSKIKNENTKTETKSKEDQINSLKEQRELLFNAESKQHQDKLAMIQTELDAEKDKIDGITKAIDDAEKERENKKKKFNASDRGDFNALVNQQLGAWNADPTAYAADSEKNLGIEKGYLNALKQNEQITPEEYQAKMQAVMVKTAAFYKKHDSEVKTHSKEADTEFLSREGDAYAEWQNLRLTQIDEQSQSYIDSLQIQLEAEQATQKASQANFDATQKMIDKLRKDTDIDLKMLDDLNNNKLFKTVEAWKEAAASIKGAFSSVTSSISGAVNALGSVVGSSPSISSDNSGNSYIASDVAGGMHAIQNASGGWYMGYPEGGDVTKDGLIYAHNKEGVIPAPWWDTISENLTRLVTLPQTHFAGATNNNFSMQFNFSGDIAGNPEAIADQVFSIFTNRVSMQGRLK